ncbi:hypothetical protein ACWDV4_10905 [Micromonospora sp. NPDC003197]
MCAFPVVVALVLDGDTPPGVGQVDAAEKDTSALRVGTIDVVLRGQARQTGVVQDEPEPTLHRGLAQRLGQREQLAQSGGARPADVRVQVAGQLGELDHPPMQQCVHRDQRVRPGQLPPEVERGEDTGGDR